MAQDQGKAAGAVDMTSGDQSSPTRASDGKSPALTMSLSNQKSASSSPPPLPKSPASSNSADESSRVNQLSTDAPPTVSNDEIAPRRRAARRRPAGPVKGTIAANDDAPSIGGLIYALEQKPSNKPFIYAAIASAVWGIAGLSFASVMVWQSLSSGSTLFDLIANPSFFFALTAVVVPIAIIWFLSLLAWRSEELRLRSSTMTEVAVRLAEPDRMAEQSIASLGQAVRRQVAFMNDAVSRALGRAGELEALVHNEVAALENSYEDNERKIRGLIQELSGERGALAHTGDHVAATLRQLGSEVPSLIEKLSHQQIRLAQIIQQAGDNLTSLESSIGSNVDRLETSVGSNVNRLETSIGSNVSQLESSLGARTEELQILLEGYTKGLASALGARSDQMRNAFESYLTTLDDSLGKRTDTLQTVFEEYAKALDTTLANRAKTLDIQLIERTKALDLAFNDRLQLFDDSIRKSTTAIDEAVGERAAALTSALDDHARNFREDLTRQTSDLDDSLTQGISAVRRTSENITRQSLKAIEGLSGQSEMLKNVSENLLGQINTVTGRFENQSQSIMKAANSLEAANYKIDVTLKARHSDLSQTLEDLTGKADEFGRFIEGYSSTIEGSLSSAEKRAREVTEQLLVGTERSRAHALSNLDRKERDDDKERRDRQVQDLQSEFAKVNNAVDVELGNFRHKFSDAPESLRQRASDQAREIAAEQQRLRNGLSRLGAASEHDLKTFQKDLARQLQSLKQLNNLANQRSARSLQSGGSQAPSNASGNQSGFSAPPQQRSLRAAYDQSSSARPSSNNGNGQGPIAQAQYSKPAPAAFPSDSMKWSDLLARAEQEDREPPKDPGRISDDFKLNLQAMANAIDPSTAQSVWARLRNGYGNAMSRSFYDRDGQALFDDFANRLERDSGLQLTVDKFLNDFERIRRDTEAADPMGTEPNSPLLSDTGRVYLFLAHARGRL